MKYGCADSGPLLVTVVARISRRTLSAVARNNRCDPVSPCTRAIAAAATRPATSSAMVDGENPVCSSHRSTPSAGPFAARKSAAGRMWLVYSAASSARPACQAIRIGSAVSSSCRPPVSGAALPFSSPLRGNEPSGNCISSNRKLTICRAVARSPSVRNPVNVS